MFGRRLFRSNWNACLTKTLSDVTCIDVSLLAVNLGAMVSLTLCTLTSLLKESSCWSCFDYFKRTLQQGTVLLPFLSPASYWWVTRKKPQKLQPQTRSVRFAEMCEKTHAQNELSHGAYCAHKQLCSCTIQLATQTLRAPRALYVRETYPSASRASTV